MATLTLSLLLLSAIVAHSAAAADTSDPDSEPVPILSESLRMAYAPLPDLALPEAQITINQVLPSETFGQPTVKTANGEVRGVTLNTRTGRPVHAFYGIPYAKPPLGDLRFKPSTPVDDWDSPLNATTKPNSCSQPEKPGSFHDFAGDTVWYANTPISEDCLYLNVWVPYDVLDKTDLAPGPEDPNPGGAPVLFWFHGGALFFGTSTSDVFQGENLAAETGVVVVSTQYRLGPLGFMFLGHPDAPGNAGLFDQYLAMQWVNKNIKAFGGDPDRITLFGESAGGASVEYHLLSPMSRTLFNSGIIMSGTYASRFQSPRDAFNTSMELAMNVGCLGRQSLTDEDREPQPLEEIITCLRSVPDSKLVSHQMEDFHKALRSPFVATVDGTFLTDTPRNLLRKGHVKRANIMIGNVRDEGPFFMPGTLSKIKDPFNPASLSYDELEEALDKMFFDRSPLERMAIIQEYTNWNNTEDGYQNQVQVAKAAGDAYLVCPSRHFADEWSSFGHNVYYYSFVHRTKSSPWAAWFGVRHTDEIEYVFGTADPGRHTEEEMQLASDIMNLWANFAKYGSPNGPRDKEKYNWDRYTSALPMYMELNTGSNFTTSPYVYGPRARECAFWNGLLPKLVDKMHEHECVCDSVTIVL